MSFFSKLAEVGQKIGSGFSKGTDGVKRAFSSVRTTTRRVAGTATSSVKGLLLVLLPLCCIALVFIFAAPAYIFFLSFIVGLCILGPLVAPSLLNDPNHSKKEGQTANEYEPSNFGFFTKIEPGMMKIIFRLGMFVRVMMDHPGFNFKGYVSGQNLRRRDEDFWEVVEAQDGAEAHPIPFVIWRGWFKTMLWIVLSPIHLPWWVWKRTVYLATGCVFVGIPPFQTVGVYPIERFKEVTDGNGKITLVRKHDYSDFYYAKEFTFWIPIGSADTKDGASTRIFLMLVMHIENAFELAFRTDEMWSARVLGTVSNAINNVTRMFNLRSIIASAEKSDEVNKSLTKAIKSENRDTKDFGKIGIRVTEVKLPDRSTTDPDLAKALEEEVKADFKAAATTKLAKGNAAAITENARAIQNAGAAGVLAGQFETRVRTAKEAGDRAVVIIGNDANTTSDTALLAAILKQKDEDDHRVTN